MKMLAMALASLGLVLQTNTQTRALEIANSVTDFSGTQGGNNWYYGYYSGNFTSSSFQEFPNYDPNFSTNEYDQYPTSTFGGPEGWYLKWGNSITGGSGGYWTSLWTNGGSPNGTTVNWNITPVEQWAVRRWVSDVSGQVTITGSIGSLNGGNMETSVLVNGTSVFSEQVPSSQTTYDFSTEVSVGEDVDFVIAPNNHDETNGATMFTAEISTVPERGDTMPYDGHTVGLGDLDNVLNNFGTYNPQGYAWPDTAANDPDPVGLADLDWVLNNFGTGTSPAIALAPEPASTGILGLGMIGMMVRRRKN